MVFLWGATNTDLYYSYDMLLIYMRFGNKSINPREYKREEANWLIQFTIMTC